MHNLVFSPIDPEKLISEISERITSNLLKEVKNDQNTSDQNNELLTVQEAANFLHLKVSTIYSKVSNGELPVMKRSKRLYFSKSELLDYLKEGRRLTFAEIIEKGDEYLSNKKGLKR